jgi:DNA-nicking Smr family endonuclease
VARRPPKDEDDDRKLFEEQMQGVRPLARRTGRAVPVVKEPAVRPAVAGPPASGLEVVERWGERYALLAAGADRRLIKELRARRPEAELDLHGMRADEARAKLRAFVGRARTAGHRALLVIHGRGKRSGAEGPVLRDVVLDALAAPPLAAEVLAVTNAPAPLGGGGAALVLVRK